MRQGKTEVINRDSDGRGNGECVVIVEGAQSIPQFGAMKYTGSCRQMLRNRSRGTLIRRASSQKPKKHYTAIRAF